MEWRNPVLAAGAASLSGAGDSDCAWERQLYAGFGTWVRGAGGRSCCRFWKLAEKLLPAHRIRESTSSLVPQSSENTSCHPEQSEGSMHCACSANLSALHGTTGADLCRIFQGRHARAGQLRLDNQGCGSQFKSRPQRSSRRASFLSSGVICFHRTFRSCSMRVLLGSWRNDRPNQR
jgi:hypothetical protein